MDKIKKWNNREIFIALLIIWFLVNIAQALLTEIISDEAYYYMYGKFLAWGYFDHPPMVALMIKLSSSLFNGNLGIRFMTVFLQLGTMFLTWLVIDDGSKSEKSQVLYFFLISASMTMFSAYGFITTPDAPLLFFTALFLFGYKGFLKNESWQTVIILSIAMAGLVYSKYQAVLVFGFVVLSNFRILKSWRFWVAGLSAIIILYPHLNWQITNDFPSFKFHLIDRSEGFKWIYFFEYLPNQMVVFNPFVLGAVIYIIIKYRSPDLFIRALYFLIIGFIGFFWITSVRGHVEPHWTVACSAPIIILLISKIKNDNGLRKYIKYFIAPSFVLILLVRILLLTNIPLMNKSGMNGKREKFEFIESVTKDLPVVFLSSFQSPSMFSYFTGKEAFPVSTLYTRQTQYDIWQFEKKYHNKPVFIIYSHCSKAKSYNIGEFAFTGYKTDSLQTTNRLKIDFEMPSDQFTVGDTMNIEFTINNPCDYDIDFNHSQFPVQVFTAFIKGKENHIQSVVLSEPIAIIHKGQSIQRKMRTTVPDLSEGMYNFGITLRTDLGPTLNCPFVKVKIFDHD
jgi:hypothetical protein